MIDKIPIIEKDINFIGMMFIIYHEDDLKAIILSKFYTNFIVSFYIICNYRSKFYASLKSGKISN